MAGVPRQHSLLRTAPGIGSPLRPRARPGGSLPSSEVDETLEKVGIEKAAPYVFQGYQLMHVCVGTICAIIKIVDA